MGPNGTQWELVADTDPSDPSDPSALRGRCQIPVIALPTLEHDCEHANMIVRDCVFWDVSNNIIGAKDGWMLTLFLWTCVAWKLLVQQPLQSTGKPSFTVPHLLKNMFSNYLLNQHYLDLRVQCQFKCRLLPRGYFTYALWCFAFVCLRPGSFPLQLWSGVFASWVAVLVSFPDWFDFIFFGPRSWTFCWKHHTCF